MKKIIIALFIAVGFSNLHAQEQDQTWHTDIKKAIEIANTKQKPLFLFFTGSDWCGWCIRLQKEVFKTPEFTAWAKDNVVLVDLDFPRRAPQSEEIKQQNAQLQQIFNVQGYPTVWFVKPTTKEGKINFEPLGSSGYMAGGPSVWIDNAKQFTSKYTSTTVATDSKTVNKAETKSKKKRKTKV